MNYSPYYERTLNNLRTKSIEELITLFNREVGNTTFVSARGSYLMALRDAFRESGFSLDRRVFGEDFTSFRHPIELRKNRVKRQRKSFTEWIAGIFGRDAGGVCLGTPF